MIAAVHPNGRAPAHPSVYPRSLHHARYWLKIRSLSCHTHIAYPFFLRLGRLAPAILKALLIMLETPTRTPAAMPKFQIGTIVLLDHAISSPPAGLECQ